MRVPALLCIALLALRAAPVASKIKTVNVVFSCHFDAGFDGIEPEPGLDSNVINKYFHDYFPKAIRVAEELRSRGGEERLVFLTHSWLASLYMDCPARIGIKCPKNTEAFAAAVARGDITWHAMPHNAQVELFDRDLLEFAVQMTHELDREFGLPAKITMSQRDVPGLTRAAIPILYGQGVRGLSVGVNGGSAPPAVPKNQPFWWRDEPSGTQLLSFWHPGGYSGEPVDTREQCIKSKGFDRALCMSWRGDNAGPPSAEEVLDIFEKVRAQFPGAKVVASGFDDFLGELLKVAPKLDLPVVTEEIGDTWIHGVASDPGRLAEYRALLRIRRANSDLYDDPRLKKFSRLLLKVPEHTWGVDIKKTLADFENWANRDFHAQLENGTDTYLTTLQSWVRQRAYSLWAVQELGDSDVGLKAWEALSMMQTSKDPPRPSEPTYEKLDLSQPLQFSSHAWELELDNKTGSIIGLGLPELRIAEGASRRKELLAGPQRTELSVRSSGGSMGSGRGGGGKGLGGFASLDNPLAQVMYSTYAEDDYSIFWDKYAYLNPPLPWWYAMDFGKPNSTVKGGAKRADVFPQLEEVWRRHSEGGLHIIAKARFPPALVEDAGAPQAVWTEIRSPSHSDDLYVDVVWEQKTATRLPETLWVRWRPNPMVVNSSSWVLHKLGQPISPLEVIGNGSHSLHAVGDEGVSVRTADGGATLSIRSLDAALVSPGVPSPFPNLSQQPDLKQGMSFALVDNIWGTNYPMWVPYQSGDANMRFRFLIQLNSEGKGREVS